MKCRYNLSMLLAVVLIIATGCVRWEIDGLPTLRDSLAEMGRCNFDYNKVIKKNPKDFAANLCRGKAYYREGQYDQAISDFTKAIAIEPRSAAAYFYRGNAYAKRGLYDMAISDYTKAIELYPTGVGAYSNRGRTYAYKGQYDMAISDFNKAIELYPKDDTHYNNLAWILATCPDAKYRNGVEALKLANKAVEIKSVAINLDTLAAAYAEMGNFEDAIKILEQAIYQLKKNGEEEKLTELMERLNYYKDNEPWRE